MGGSLEFCNTSGGDQKNFTHTVGGITKNLQNLKNFQSPPPLLVKNDTSLRPKCSRNEVASFPTVLVRHCIIPVIVYSQMSCAFLFSTSVIHVKSCPCIHNDYVNPS